MPAHCCDEMASAVDKRCDIHDDPFDCPDVLLAFNSRLNAYGLIVHDGGTSTIRIRFCPWCGSPLGTSAAPQL